MKKVAKSLPGQSKSVSTALAAVFVFSILASPGVGQTNQRNDNPSSKQQVTESSANSSLGERIPFRNGELYFTENVTARQAETLVSFLDEMYGHLTNFKSYQLDKDGRELVVKTVVNDAALKTTELDESFTAVEFLLQIKVFAEQEVRLELTDLNFKTGKTFNDLKMGSLGKRITFNNSEMFFTKDVTRKEATALVDYLITIAGEQEISFQVDRDGSTMLLRMVGNETAIKTKELDDSFAALELDLQKIVFKDENVRFELTNFKFEAQKMIDKHPV